MKKMNFFYEAPCVEIAEMQVEQCVLSGSSYGAPGKAGQNSGFIVFGEDL